MALTTYLVEKMRVTIPSGKTAERNPERAFAVSGIFYSTEEKNGKLVRKDKMSFASKYVDVEDVNVDGFQLDVEKGILTVPAGEKGRKAAEGITQDAIAARLAELRKVETAPDSETATE